VEKDDRYELQKQKDRPPSAWRGARAVAHLWFVGARIDGCPDAMQVNLDLWDTAGQTEFDSMTSKIYEHREVLESGSW